MSTLDWLKSLKPGTTAARVDHPMASLEEAQALLAQLPAGNPKRCLAEAENWLSTVALTEGFAPALRAQIVSLIEDRAAGCVAALVSETFAAAGGATEAYAAVDQQKTPPDPDPAFLKALLEYGTVLADAQHRCLGAFGAEDVEAQAELRGMLARHAHAVARRMALRRLSRLPADPQDWQQLDACFARAAAMKSTRTAQVIGGKGGPSTSVLREYLRAVLFDLGAPESLNPRANELLYRLAGRQAPVAQLVAERAPGAMFAAFPGKGIGPRPVARVSAGSKSARFLDLSQCVAQLRELAADPAGTKALPADRALLAEFGKPERVAVFAHAIAHWGANPPHRNENRIALSGTGRIVGGFAGALRVIEPADQGAWLRDLAALGPLAGEELAEDPKKAALREPAPMRVQDASPRGLGILVPRSKAGWARVGAIAAVHVESAAGWALVAVRRLGAVGPDLRLGLQVLAPHPRALWLRVPGVDSERLWARSKKPLDVAAGLVRGLLPAMDARGLVPGQLLLDPGIAEATDEFEVPLPDRLQCIKVAKRLGATGEFARVAFVLTEARALPRWAMVLQARTAARGR